MTHRPPVLGSATLSDGVVVRPLAERLGFRPEEMRRESQWITDRCEDHVVCGLLDRESEAHRHG